MATTLVFAVQPAGATGGTPFTTQPVIRVVDADGAIVRSARAVVTIGLAVNPAGGTLGGTLTLTATGGVATFTDLALDKVGSGYTLAALAEGLAPASSAAFAVSPGAPRQLVFATQPGGAAGGTAFGTQPVAEVLDPGGNRAAGPSVSITAALGANPGGGQLSGTTTVTTTTGVASFADLSIDKVGDGYTLTVGATGLTGATSAPFAVSLGAPHHLTFTTQPGGATGGAPFATQPVVEVLDAGGNRAAGYAITIALGANPGGAALAGTRTVTSVDGLASFTDLSIDKAGGYTLIATLDSISSTSTPFDVAVGPAKGLRFVTQPQGGWDTGVPLDSQPSVEVVDAGGNRVTRAADTVFLSIGTNPSGGTLSGTTTGVAMAGVVAFTGLSLNRSGTGYTLVASAPGRSNATSAPFTVQRWTGQIRIAVTTTGLNFDPDGYLVRMDSGPAQALPLNGSTQLDSVPPGAHHLSLGGAAFNCTLADTALNLSVQSGVASQLAVAVACRRYLSNEVVITTDQFGGSEVMVMNPDGSAKTRLTYQGGVSGTVSPDGLTIAFASQRGGNGYGIYLMNADGTGVRELVHRSDFDGSPAWSPDGTRLAFRSMTDGPYGAYGRIWVVNADGTGLRQVSPDVDSTTYVFDDSPSWFPDGHRVLYSRSGFLYVVDVDKGVVTPVGNGSFTGDHPRLSPDGSKIAFAASAGGNYDIYVVDVDGSNLVRLTTDPAQDDMPVWSPDGTQLLFARVANDTFHIYTMSVAAGGGTPLGTVTAWGELAEDWARVK